MKKLATRCNFFPSSFSIMFARYAQTSANAGGALLRRATLNTSGRQQRWFSDKTAISGIKKAVAQYGTTAIGTTFAVGIVALKSIEIIPAGQVGVVDLFGKREPCRHTELFREKKKKWGEGVFLSLISQPLNPLPLDTPTAFPLTTTHLHTCTPNSNQ